MLFAYCVEALGFCKSSAGRRIAAARVCRKYPVAFARVAGTGWEHTRYRVCGRELRNERRCGLPGRSRTEWPRAFRASGGAAAHDPSRAARRGEASIAGAIPCELHGGRRS